MSESSSVRNYTWINEPPIRFVEFEDVEAKVKEFQFNLGQWGTMGGDTELSARINGQRGGASFIAGPIVDKLDPGRPVFEYHIDGQPIALLQLDLYRKYGDCLEIKNVAAHPGAEEAGGIMVEYALNKIDHYNAQRSMFDAGMIYLESYNDASTAAYRALGFSVIKNDKMLLDAARSPKWQQVSGTWRLASKVAEGRTRYRSR